MTERDGQPIDPGEARLLLHALVDGELDAASASALERRLATDPPLAAERARIVALRSAMRQLPRPEPSAELRKRVIAIGADASARPARSFDWRALAATALIASLLAGGGTYWGVSSVVPEDMAGDIASSHRRALIAPTPVDMASSDRHQVKPWLDAKIGLSPPADDLARDGFPLVGARIDVIGNHVAPTLVYRHNEHLISVVALPRAVSSQPPAGPSGSSARGFSLVTWEDRAFTYWAISDLERAELDAFVRLFQARAAEKG